jgi:hypothetical protein
MDLVSFLAPLKLIHVLAALAFVLAHGTSAAVSLRLRTLRDRATIVAYLDLSERTMGATYVALLVVFVGGIISGIAGGYWTSGRLWLWASLAIFLGIGFEMSFVRWRYLLRVRNALGIAPDQRAGKGPPPASDAELAAALDSRIPVVNFVVGVGGIAILVWLMMMKPF